MLSVVIFFSFFFFLSLFSGHKTHRGQSNQNQKYLLAYKTQEGKKRKKLVASSSSSSSSFESEEVIFSLQLSRSNHHRYKKRVYLSLLGEEEF